MGCVASGLPPDCGRRGADRPRGPPVVTVVARALAEVLRAGDVVEAVARPGCVAVGAPSVGAVVAPARGPSPSSAGQRWSMPSRPRSDWRPFGSLFAPVLLPVTGVVRDLSSLFLRARGPVAGGGARGVSARAVISIISIIIIIIHQTSYIIHHTWSSESSSSSSLASSSSAKGTITRSNTPRAR